MCEAERQYCYEGKAGILHGWADRAPEIGHVVFCEVWRGVYALENPDAAAIFEASFIADQVFVAVDALERLGSGFKIVEVKSTTSQKEEHIPDAAIQTHVLAVRGSTLNALRSCTSTRSTDSRVTHGPPTRGLSFCRNANAPSPLQPDSFWPTWQSLRRRDPETPRSA